MLQKKIAKELQNLLTQLEIEKQEDLHQYNLKMQSNSLIDRRNAGVCWYPVKLEKTNYDAGENLLVRVSRNTEHIISHLFQSGKLVSLFSNSGKNNESETYVTGIVNRVSELEMLITINADTFPDWINDGKLGVQLLFDDNSYEEMKRALNFLLKTEDETLIHLINIILGDSEPEFDEKYPVTIPTLNESQNKALNLVLSAKDLAIVHGPPGTGKTTTLIEAIGQFLKTEKQVMVTAPSNAAVDLLVEKLIEKGINVLRIGHPARVEEKILKATLDARITHHQSYADLKAAKKEADELFRKARKYKRNFGEKERQERKELFAQARRLLDEAKMLSHYIKNNILDNAQVIACTLVGAANPDIRSRHFGTVIIDEASQGLEPATWIPIIRANRVIMAGDHKQLPPTIKSPQAVKNGLEITLFEKAIKRNQAEVMLQEQYRMNEVIMNFPSQYFYKNQLIANSKVKNWKIFESDTVLEFIDTAGTGFNEETDQETQSTFNSGEVDLLFKHFENYINEAIANNAEIKDIGIISPYKAQVMLLQEYFSEMPKPAEIDLDKIVSINTVDSFQGQERDIIYISLVRSNDNGKIGFLSDIRRMNVAMTRARKKLVIIGDSGTICQNEFYDALFNYVNKTSSYRSAYEFLY